MVAVLGVPDRVTRQSPSREIKVFNFLYPPLARSDYNNKTFRVRTNPVESTIKDLGGREIYGEDEQRFKPFNNGSVGFRTINRWKVVYSFPDKYGRDLTGARAIVEGDLFGNHGNRYSGPTIKVRIESSQESLPDLEMQLHFLEERMNDGFDWHQFSFIREQL